jgi:ribulose-phosphate 3-epimerase
MNKIKIAPSILSADFSKLGDEIRKTENGGADVIHFDVMDGHFVPNITMGPAIIKSTRSVTKLPFIAHLMIENPDRYVDKFADAGCQIIAVHAEACDHLHRTVNYIKELGAKPGVALNPATPLSALDYVIEDISMITIMTVNPGFSGQKFIRGVVPKISAARKIIDEKKLQVDIEVDGGVNVETAPIAVKAGATILVAASAIFDGKNSIEDNIAKLRHASEL